MPRLVIDARTVRPGMTGVGYWAMEITKAAARLAARQGGWAVAALTLTSHSAHAISGVKRPHPPSTAGRGFPFFTLTSDDRPDSQPPRLDRQEEDELDRIERSWSEVESLLRVPVPHDYQSHPSADLWLHAGGMARLLHTLKADVLFSPTFLVPLRAPCPRIGTFLDFIAWRYPATYPFGFRHYVRASTRFAARRSSALVTISDSVQRDARSILGVSRRRMRTITPGVAAEFRPMPEGGLLAVRTAHGLPQPPYFIWVGNLERRKDLPTALRAFESLIESSAPPDAIAARLALRSAGSRPSAAPARLPVSLLIVGRRAPGADEVVTRLQRSPARPRIRWVADLPRGVLAAALAGAQALIFTSRYEGFGLPVAEAMACGAPVIAARNSSIPEVLGDAGILVAPGDDASFRDAMQRILENPGLQNDLSAKGRARASLYRWERSAELLLDLAGKVLQRSSRQQ